MISPNGKRLVGDPGGNITIQEFGRGTTTRLTMGPSRGTNPAWSPDGRYVAYNGSGASIEKRRTEEPRRKSCFARRRWRFPRAGRPMDTTSFMRRSIQEQGRTCLPCQLVSRARSQWLCGKRRQHPARENSLLTGAGSLSLPTTPAKARSMSFPFHPLRMRRNGLCPQVEA